ncbi:MAG: hypothetical protein Q7R49_03820 [Candidatus Daviesbacteria bacterium]|nr:hypothetical protein [Candidatus Daviesbacteria bacterium]
MNGKNAVNINLLPISFRQKQQQNSKFYKIQTISIFLLLSLIFLTSLTLAMRFLQTQQIQAAEVNFQNSNNKVSSLKSKEASLIIVKDRLTTIDAIASIPSNQRAIYNLVSQLIPPSLSLSFVSVDANGNMIISLVAPNFTALDGLLSDLTSKEKNENRVKQVSLESFSRSRDGLYRASLKIIPN